MDHNKHSEEHHITGYGVYILVWLGLIALTSITVTVAGIDFGMIALAVAMTIAAIKSMLVINIFMHIKAEQPIFKVFIAISGITLTVIFILTFLDFTYR